MPRSPAEQGDQERLWILHPQVLADSADDSHSTPPVYRRSLIMNDKGLRRFLLTFTDD